MLEHSVEDALTKNFATSVPEKANRPNKIAQNKFSGLDAKTGHIMIKDKKCNHPIKGSHPNPDIVLIMNTEIFNFQDKKVKPSSTVHQERAKMGSNNPFSLYLLDKTRLGLLEENKFF